MARSDWEIEHLAKEQAKWWWKKYAIRHEHVTSHLTGADWYKYRKGPDRRFMTPEQRAAFRKRMLRADVRDITSEYLAVDRHEFDSFLDRELLKAGPVFPDFPVFDWLAKSIFRWYWPALWNVDLNAPDWLFQIRDADHQRSFSFAECEAYARRKHLKIDELERLFLRVVTREGATRDVRRFRWRREYGDRPPYVLEGFHNPRMIPSRELCRSLAMSNAEAKARRRLTRHELAGNRPTGRGRRAFTPSGRIKHSYFKTEGT